MRALLRRTILLLRDAWLVAGLSLALFLALEFGYRAQAGARRVLRGGQPVRTELLPAHPNAGESWWTDIFTERDPALTSDIRYDPFRGWWPRTHESRAVNVDADGHRVTVQPAATGSRRLVYMFGGSVMWGWVVRDSFTIPSLVAARLRERGYTDVEVVNLAQSMFDLAQNVATLNQELRHGRVPAVAVFLDGNNEIAPPRQSGEVGRVLNEALLAERFSRPSTLGAELLALTRHSELVRRVTTRAAVPSPGNADQCRAIASSYQRQVRAASAVAAEFGFAAVFVWQPMLATSQKVRSAWEMSVARDTAWDAMVARCSSIADSLLSPTRGRTFVPLSSLFDRDTGSVFVDDFGHVTERGNGVIATAIAGLVAERLGPPGSARPRAPSPR